MSHFLMVAAVAAILQSPAPPPQPTTPPQLRLESFAPTRAYCVGIEQMVFAAVVRNTGGTVSPAQLQRLQFYTLSGLDYGGGDTQPFVPPLEPGAATVIKFRAAPTAPDAPLVAAASLMRPDGPPSILVAPVQHFERPIPGDTIDVPKVPTARAGDTIATAENDRVRVRLVLSQSGVPALLVSARTAGGWRRTGVSVPLAEVMSAEGGQVPWWEVFRCTGLTATADARSAALSAEGGFGIRWRGTVRVTVALNSSAIDVHLALSPLKRIRIHGLRMARLQCGDRSFGTSYAEEITPAVGPTRIVAAARWGVVTAGVVWPSQPPFPEWTLASLPAPEGVDYRQMAVEYTAGEKPALLTPGTLIEWHATVLALGSSSSVEEARGVPLTGVVAQPPKPTDQASPPPLTSPR